MKVKELIAHLQKLPPKLSVFQLWDEGGTYHEKTDIPKEQDIVKSNNCCSYGGKEWTDDRGWGEDEEGNSGKEFYKVFERRKVVVI